MMIKKVSILALGLMLTTAAAASAGALSPGKKATTVRKPSANGGPVHQCVIAPVAGQGAPCGAGGESLSCTHTDIIDLVDGCETGQSKVHECVVRKGTAACNADHMQVCDGGFYDPCTTHEAKVHECWPAHGSQPCSMKLEIMCPEGYTDECLVRIPE